MRHDFRYVLLMVSAMRSLGNPKLKAGLCVGPGNDPVEPLLVAVDPQDLSSRIETSTLLHATAESNLFQLILWSQSRFNIFRIQRV